MSKASEFSCGGWDPILVRSVKPLIDAAVVAEREACAAIADAFHIRPDGPTDTGRIWRNSTAASIARSIRSRRDDAGVSTERTQ